MIKILAVGNSFSEDANRYLHYIAKEEGVDIQNSVLYIPGCPLERHFRNMMDDKKDYELQVAGNKTFFKTSLREALTACSWDYITLQQASPNSPYFDTYIPYISKLADYVRELCPKAKILIHETWAWETGSQKIEAVGFKTYEEMFTLIRESYKKAASLINADGIIPSGTAMLKAQSSIKVHRPDGFHASFGVGRFILALTWYKHLTGNSIDNIKFKNFDTEVTEEEYSIAIKAVNDTIQ